MHLKSRFVENWKLKLSQLNKCDLYCMYKTNFEREKYLGTLPPSLAIVLCQYRTSNHKLEVERLRYHRPFIPRFQRKCKKYALNETGNEFHHLLVCPKFSILREKHIKNKYTRKISLISLLNLLNSKNRKVMINLAIFIRESMKHY